MNQQRTNHLRSLAPVFLARAFFFCVVLVANFGFAQSPGEKAFLKLVERESDGSVVPLWPGDGSNPMAAQKTLGEEVQTPRSGAIQIKNVGQPSLIIVPPPNDKKPTGVTILFAPGGGYGNLSLSTAVDICHWAGTMGAHCALLKYSVPHQSGDTGHRVPLADAQRAIRLLRESAEKLHIDADKIIVVGASAGGHLTLNLANNHDEKTYDRLDAVDDLSAKPNAVVLMYPAYLTQPIRSLTANTHLNLNKLGPRQTPPVFMTVTRPDKFNWGALNTMLQLREARVPSELHVYPQGGHSYPQGGHGGCFDKYPLMDFIRPAASFLNDQKLITDQMQQASDNWLAKLEAEFLDRTTGDSDSHPQIKQLTALPESDWSPADRKLAALRDSPPLVIRLWPGNGSRPEDPAADLIETLPARPDGLVRVTNVSTPTMHYWRPPAPDGRAVVIFPGGAYNGLATQHEGTDIAAWLNRQGIVAFVVKYRVPRRAGLEKHAVALQDAQRAIRIVRSRAAEFGIKPDQIGVLGFSAGGHLAALTVHQAKIRSYDVIDEIDKVSSRPDFAVLIYPAYLTAEGGGPELDPLIAPFPSRKDYPPIFSAVAADDRFAPDSIYYALHLHQQKVAGELHVYTSGGHGKGLREAGGPFARWTRSCERWLTDLKHEN